MVLLEPPVDISRDDAAREAAKELAKPAYGQAGDNLISRAIGKVLDLDHGHARRPDRPVPRRQRRVC